MPPGYFIVLGPPCLSRTRTLQDNANRLVAYARRIPQLSPKGKTPSKHPPNPEHYLVQSMRQLSELEGAFLEVPPK